MMADLWALLREAQAKVRELETTCSSCYDAQQRGEEHIRELEKEITRLRKSPAPSPVDLSKASSEVHFLYYTGRESSSKTLKACYDEIAFLRACIADLDRITTPYSHSPAGVGE
jgi:hypothetical protein